MGGSRVGTAVGVGNALPAPLARGVLSPCPLVHGQAGQDKGSGGSCWARAQGRPRPPGAPAASAAPRGGRPPLSAPPPRVGSAGSGRHRAARAGHCAPWRSSATLAQSEPLRLPGIFSGPPCHRRGDCFNCHGALHYAC